MQVGKQNIYLSNPAPYAKDDLSCTRVPSSMVTKNSCRDCEWTKSCMHVRDLLSMEKYCDLNIISRVGVLVE